MSTKLDHIKQYSWDSSLLAVSGGVDSITLLHLLGSKSSHQKDRLEVAYVDHSQREDTDLDLKVIRQLTAKLGIRLHITRLNLPKNCSEQQAREARYQALHTIRKKEKLRHLVTAHHADDVLETAIINITRGTGPRGISSLRHQPDGVWRPFLFDFKTNNYITKQDILSYAKLHKLIWHEDSTNQSPDYLRNRIRQRLYGFADEDKLKFLNLISNNVSLIKQIDKAIANLDLSLKSETSDGNYRVDLFTALPEDIKNQFLHNKISHHGHDVSKDSVIRAKEFIQTKTTGKLLQLKGCNITINKGGLFMFQTTKTKS